MQFEADEAGLAAEELLQSLKKAEEKLAVS